MKPFNSVNLGPHGSEQEEQEMDHMNLWQRVCRTDPRAVKPITGKQYQGNSPKPYWIVQRLTEEFGPCGIGWGYTVLNERMERLTDAEVLHVALLRFWYVLNGQRGEVEQIGQTKAVYAKKDGSLLVDEDAPKKSVTDALVKCASYIGFAGDIFSGRWDDSKYVAEVRREYEEKDRQEDPKAKRLAELDELALTMIEAHHEGRDMDAIKAWYDDANFAKENDIAQEERLYLWSQLREESKLRSTIKANRPTQLKEAA